MAMKVNDPQDSTFNFFELDEERLMQEFSRIPKNVELKSVGKLEHPSKSDVTNFVTPGENVVSYPDHFILG